MPNALTIDLEDWYHGCCGVPQPDVPPEQRRLRRNTEKILALLDQCGIKATFFVLGQVAEEEPALVPLIAAAGHEISSHGYSHTLASNLRQDTFRDEVRRTRDILGAQAGIAPVGFRAPQWSLGAETPWALAILKEEGCCYDSSYSPLHFVGDPRGPREPFHMTAGGGSILEFPPMVTPSPFCNLPTGGGWGFRFFPLSLIRCTIRSLNERGFPAVLYLHPRELDPDGPRLKLSPLQSFVSYGPRTDAGARLRELLTSFPFQTLKELTRAWLPA